MRLSPETQAKLDKLKLEDRENVIRLAAEALFLRHLNRKPIEPLTSEDEKSGYSCISAQLAWSSNTPEEDRIESILNERAARLGKEAKSLIPKSGKS